MQYSGEELEAVMAGLSDFLKIWTDVALPLSGAVNQRILSPTFELQGQGDPALEKQIVEDVASYGAQLGELTEVLLALVDGKEQGAALVKLRRIADGVATKKRAYRERALSRARAALDELKARDPAGYRALIAARGG